MSKKRNRHLSLSSVLDNPNSTSLKRSKPIFGVSTSKSFYIPNHSSTISHNNKVDFSDYKREKMLNKQIFVIIKRNVSFFRDISGQDDPGMLHFMSSLRQNRTLDCEKSQRNIEVEPFSVSMKQTMNQTFRKTIFESTAKQSRISTAYYRWHNRSGKGTTTCVDFECSLRDYNTGMNPEEGKFSNLVKPILYQDVQKKVYDEKEIVCPRQKKLFRLKAK